MQHHEATIAGFQPGYVEVADVPTWYRNKNGRVTQNWPFDLHTYWSRTLEPDLADYELA